MGKSKRRRKKPDWELVVGGVVVGVAAVIGVGWWQIVAASTSKRPPQLWSLPMFLAIAIGVVGVLLMLSSRYEPGPEPSLEERALALANRVKACDPKHHRDKRFRFSSPYGHSDTVAEHIALFGIDNGPRFRRRYTGRLHDNVKSVIDDLAKAGEKRDSLRRFRLDRPADSELYDPLALNLFWAADTLYKEKHGLTD